MYSKMFILSLVRSIFFIPQTATFTFLRTYIPAISHLCKIERSPEKFKNDLISFITFFTEVFFLKMNVVSSA